MKSRIFALLIAISSLFPSLGFSSEFDAAIEPCSGKFSESELRQRGSKLLNGQLNFIKVYAENGSDFHYTLNCPRRMFALLVIKEQKENWATTYKALDVIGWQSTFSNEVAQTLIEFILSTPNNSLKRKAAWAFYFLLDGMPQVSVQVDFYSQDSFKNFYLDYLSSDNTGAAFHLAQVAQKTAGYFLQPPQADRMHCYRPSITLEKRILGEKLARNMTPILIDALFKRLENTPTNEIIRNEIFVALRNFSYSEFLKRDKEFVLRLKSYKTAAPKNSDVVLVDDVLEGLAAPCL